MKVFLSWSGETSKQAALALHAWLPTVIQTVKPYMSAENIDKGERWSVDIAKQLEECHFGIVCVTPENKDAPWILFEAGALSKSMEKARVSPLAFGVSASDFTNSPLLQFQFTLFKRNEVRKLLYSMNDAAPENERLPKDILTKSFERAWNELEEEIGKIKFGSAPKRAIPEASSKPTSNLDATLDELLTIARSQIKLLRSPEELLPAHYLARFVRSEGTNKEAPMGLWRDLTYVRTVLEYLDKFGTKRDGEIARLAYRKFDFALIYLMKLHGVDPAGLISDLETFELQKKLIATRQVNPFEQDKSSPEVLRSSTTGDVHLPADDEGLPGNTSRDK